MISACHVCGSAPVPRSRSALGAATAGSLLVRRRPRRGGRKAFVQAVSASSPRRLPGTGGPQVEGWQAAAEGWRRAESQSCPRRRRSRPRLPPSCCSDAAKAPALAPSSVSSASPTRRSAGSLKREDANRAAELERANEQGRQPQPAWLHRLGFASESERHRYYGARAPLSHEAWLDWHDVRAGRLTPAEKRTLRAAGTE